MKEYVKHIKIQTIDSLNTFDKEIDTLIHLVRLDNTHYIEKKKIILDIDSPGGVIMSADAILDIFKKLEDLGWIIETRVKNLAASMGSVFSQAGTVGHRFMSKNGRLMFHNLSTGFTNQRVRYEEIVDMYEETSKTNLRLQTFLVRNSKMKLKDYQRKVHKYDWYVGYEEAKELGFIDGELLDY